MKRLLPILLLFSFAFAQSAQIVDVNNVTQNVLASAAFRVYVDTFGANPDFALRLCDVGQRYVAAVYSANVTGTFVYTTVSKNLTAGSTDTLVYTTHGPGPCYYTPVDAFAFSQFRDFTRTPPVFVSAFPGRLHALYSTSPDASASPDLIPMDYADGWLEGGYSVSRSFNQGTARVTANVNSIDFVTEFGTITRLPSDPDWGLNSSTGRSMLVALCDDDFGNYCSDATIVNSTADLPASLAVGAPISDQFVYNRYVVVDGLGYPICIGADLAAGISANPSNIIYGDQSNVTITVTNVGNVDVTTNFDLLLNITGPGGYFVQHTWTIPENLPVGASTTRNWSFNATGQSGTYTFVTYADVDDDIAECSHTDNMASTNVVVQPVYYLHVWIDGQYNDTFPQWGRPYNVTFFINDSNGNVIPNARYRVTEANGLNPFIPTQEWNDTGTLHGISTSSVSNMQGNASGYMRLNIVPTCNKLYTTYSYLGVDTYVGNYAVIVNAYTAGGSPLQIAYNGSLTYNRPLWIGNWTCADPTWVNDKDLVNKDTYFLWIYDWIYEVFSITKKLVVP